MRTTTIGLILLVALAGCTQPRATDVPLGSRPLATFDRDQVQPEADRLMTELGVGPALRRQAIAQLRSLLSDPELVRLMASRGLNGVAAYRLGGGGLVISGGGGEGLAAFAGGRASAPFAVESFKMGANIGGGNTFGVMLVLGLRHEARFADTYNLSQTGGSVGSASFASATAEALNGMHQLRIVATGVGFGAEAGGGRLIVKWPAAR